MVPLARGRLLALTDDGLRYRKKAQDVIIPYRDIINIYVRRRWNAHSVHSTVYILVRSSGSNITIGAPFWTKVANDEIEHIIEELRDRILLKEGRRIPIQAPTVAGFIGTLVTYLGMIVAAAALIILAPRDITYTLICSGVFLMAVAVAIATALLNRPQGPSFDKVAEGEVASFVSDKLKPLREQAEIILYSVIAPAKLADMIKQDKLKVGKAFVVWLSSFSLSFLLQRPIFASFGVKIEQTIFISWVVQYVLPVPFVTLVIAVPAVTIKILSPKVNWLRLAQTYMLFAFSSTVVLSIKDAVGLLAFLMFAGKPSQWNAEVFRLVPGCRPDPDNSACVSNVLTFGLENLRSETFTKVGEFAKVIVALNIVFLFVLGGVIFINQLKVVKMTAGVSYAASILANIMAILTMATISLVAFQV